MTKIVVKDDGVTLESDREALFYGLLQLWGIPVERTTRLWPEGRSDGKYQWCPGFYLSDLGLWVEVKDSEDDDDRTRYAAWRMSGKKLAVLRRGELHALRTCLTHDSAIVYLQGLATAPGGIAPPAPAPAHQPAPPGQ